MATPRAGRSCRVVVLTVLTLLANALLPSCVFWRSDAEQPPPGPPPSMPMTLEPVWTFAGGGLGSFGQCAVDPMSHEIWIAFRWIDCPEGDTMAALRLNPRGEQVSIVPLKGVPHLPPYYPSLRLARLEPGGDASLIVATRGVFACDRSGRVIWTYERALPHSGKVQEWWRTPTDLEVADLDGDGRDEVLLAFTHYGGRDPVQALNSDGSLRWEYSGTHPSSIAVGSMQASRNVEIFLPHGHGVRTLDATGRDSGYHPIELREPRRNWALPTDFAVFAPVGPDGRPALVAGFTSALAMACVGADKTQRWRGVFPDNEPGAGVLTVAAARRHPLLALGFGNCRRGVWRQAHVLVQDLRTGQRLAAIMASGDISWLDEGGPDPPLLLVVGGSTVTAYRLVPGVNHER